jgi:hypothetical protein
MYLKEYLVVLFISVFLTSAIAGQADMLIIQRPYVLPMYPEEASKVWLKGNYELEVHVNEGLVKAVKFKSVETLDRANKKYPKDSPWTIEFTNAIEKAVRSWIFIKGQAGRFRLTVIYQQVDTYYEPSAKGSYTIYRVEGEPDHQPVKIVVEVHRVGTFAD